MENRVRRLIQKISGRSDFEMESSLRDIGLDSIKTMELLICIEEDFGVEISEEDMLPENFKTPQAIVRLMNKVVVR